MLGVSSWLKEVRKPKLTLNSDETRLFSEKKDVSWTIFCAPVRFSTIWVLFGDCAVISRPSPSFISVAITHLLVPNPHGWANEGRIWQLSVFKFLNKWGFLHLMVNVRCDHTECDGKDWQAKEYEENVHEDELGKEDWGTKFIIMDYTSR